MEHSLLPLLQMPLAREVALLHVAREPAEPRERLAARRRLRRSICADVRLGARPERDERLVRDGSMGADA